MPKYHSDLMFAQDQKSKILPLDDFVINDYSVIMHTYRGRRFCVFKPVFRAGKQIICIICRHGRRQRAATQTQLCVPEPWTDFILAFTRARRSRSRTIKTKWERFCICRPRNLVFFFIKKQRSTTKTIMPRAIIN